MFSIASVFILMVVVTLYFEFQILFCACKGMKNLSVFHVHARIGIMLHFPEHNVAYKHGNPRNHNLIFKVTIIQVTCTCTQSHPQYLKTSSQLHHCKVYVSLLPVNTKPLNFDTLFCICSPCSGFLLFIFTMPSLSCLLITWQLFIPVPEFVLRLLIFFYFLVKLLYSWTFIHLCHLTLGPCVHMYIRKF